MVVGRIRLLANSNSKLSDVKYPMCRSRSPRLSTITELIEDEAIGLMPKGQGRNQGRLESARRKLQVNLSGGLKAKSHPIGTTGVSMHVICANVGKEFSQLMM